MELFYSKDISSGGTFLDEQESSHCVKVLRHKVGDKLSVIDGQGNLFNCEIIVANQKKVEFNIISKIEGYGAHSYYLHMAVAPPKNIDRFEWFTEKSTEIGIDEITPLFGDYSERKVFKKERCERIVVSAAKQSHKGAIPIVNDAVKVKDFLNSDYGNAVKLICYCDQVDSFGAVKKHIKTILNETVSSGKKEYVVMIGPEGDFSREEIKLALEKGWQAVSLGESRLRIETAALTAVAAVYISF